MNANNLLILGLKSRVAALNRGDGTAEWETELPSGMGDSFVTLISDDRHVYAYTAGQVHCLDLYSGKLQWSNGLKGYGYGTASLGFPGGATTPDPAAYERIRSAQQSSAAGAAMF